MVEHLDDLEVGVVGQRQDHVAGAEARVHTAVLERRPEKCSEPLGSPGQSVRAGGEGEMVEAHTEIVNMRLPAPSRGVGMS